MSGSGGKGLLLKADSIAVAFIDEVKRSLAERSRPPKLVGILATASAPSQFYADFTRKQCDELGVEFVLKKTVAADTGEANGEGVEEAIIEANEDDSVDGIMVFALFLPPLSLTFALQVYYPIFGPQQVIVNNILRLKVVHFNKCSPV
jgi:methylenetetrahydrofolate dehydrogenase (NAD+)